MSKKKLNTTMQIRSNKVLHIIGWHDTNKSCKNLQLLIYRDQKNDKIAGEIICNWVNDNTFFLLNFLSRKFELIANIYFECTIISFSILQIWQPGIHHTVKYNRNI